MNRKKRKKKSIVPVILILIGWIFFIVLIALYFFVFKDKINESKNNASEVNDVQNEEVAEEKQEIVYTINSDIEITALLTDYFNALVSADQTMLQSVVTDPSVYDDMTIVNQKAQVITKYSNVTCYILPGYEEEDMLVFVTTNISIAGINSTPLDINTFYIQKTDGNYKINNGALSSEVNQYIAEMTSMEDIQKLYKNVSDNINQCIENDSDFAEFYGKLKN